MRFSTPLLAAVFLTAALGGCLDEEDPATAATTPLVRPIDSILNTTVTTTMTFTESIVDAAVSIQADLYEPTLDVSDEGTIYIAGHTAGVDTTGAPAYFSTDDGATWANLPFAGSAATPEPVPGGTPPPSDEVFIVAGEDGWAYGVDITAATFPITFWSDNGGNMAYHNPNAYNRADGIQQGCDPSSLNDRPWAAYANGTLLMVNNPGSSFVQIAVMDVPPANPLPVDAPGNPVTGPTWNTCASSKGDYIPGIPDMEESGTFAVPNYVNADGVQYLNVITGNKADIFDLTETKAFNFEGVGGIVSNYGQAAYDTTGNLFISIVNNTIDDNREIVEGVFTLAVSQDGISYETRSFVAPAAVESLYIDGNLNGTGALAVWAVDAGAGISDWYIGHIKVGRDGAPVLENVALVIDDGPKPSAHVTGSAIGPDGRAYLAMFNRSSVDPLGAADEPGSTPLSVWIQQDGPVLGS